MWRIFWLRFHTWRSATSSFCFFNDTKCYTALCFRAVLLHATCYDIEAPNETHVSKPKNLYFYLYQLMKEAHWPVLSTATLKVISRGSSSVLRRAILKISTSADLAPRRRGGKSFLVLCSTKRVVFGKHQKSARGGFWAILNFSIV